METRAKLERTRGAGSARQAVLLSVSVGPQESFLAVAPGGHATATVAKEGDRFSEDIELTYDIRKLIADLTGGEKFLPADRSRASI